MKTIAAGLLLLAIYATTASAHSSGLCGGLGAGTNPCPFGEGGDGSRGRLVKPHQRQRPHSFASPAAINQAASLRDALRDATRPGVIPDNAASVNNGAYSNSGYGRLGDDCDSGPNPNERGLLNNDDYEGGPSPADLLSLGQDVIVAPKFQPVGDVCFGKNTGTGRSGDSELPNGIIVKPARPAKINCSPGLSGVTRSDLTQVDAAPANSRGLVVSGRTHAPSYGYNPFGRRGSTRGRVSRPGHTHGGASHNGAARGGIFGRIGIGARPIGGGFNNGPIRGRQGPFNIASFGTGSFNMHSLRNSASGATASGNGPASNSFRSGMSGYSNQQHSGALFGVTSDRASNSQHVKTVGTNDGCGDDAVIRSLLSNVDFSPKGGFALPTADTISGVSDLNGGDIGGENLSFAEQESIYTGQNQRQAAPSIAADPVSVALAYRKLLEPLQNLANGYNSQRNVPEATLSFGPKTVPVDGQQRIVEPDIPEERLQVVDKPIVELQLSPAPQSTPGQDGPVITYSDLGYGPVAPSGNAFLSRLSQPSAQTNPATRTQMNTLGPDDGSPCGPMGPPLPGYIPGGIVPAPRNQDSVYVEPVGSYELPEEAYGGEALNSRNSYGVLPPVAYENYPNAEQDDCGDIDTISRALEDDARRPTQDASGNPIAHAGLLSKLWKLAGTNENNENNNDC